MRIRSVGAHALLLEVEDPPAWFAELQRRRAAGELAALEFVPGAQTVLLDGLADPAAAAETIRTWAAPPPAEEVGTDPLEIPVEFGGDDLDTVASLWHTDADGVVRRLCSTPLWVAFCGFAPGWAYLAGLPPELAVPRLDTPRPRVPAGSVALADTYAGIYPTSSPGGWRLVGRTEVSLFSPDRDPPALLTPGRRVRFTDGATG
jgi:KipI family sensor histidine kinase inhibitor